MLKILKILIIMAALFFGTTSARATKVKMELFDISKYDVTNVRYVLLQYASMCAATVKEIYAMKSGFEYRIIVYVRADEDSSTGFEGPIIEITKRNGVYWPAKVIYQLSIDKVHLC